MKGGQDLTIIHLFVHYRDDEFPKEISSSVLDVWNNCSIFNIPKDRLILKFESTPTFIVITQNIRYMKMFDSMNWRKPYRNYLILMQDTLYMNYIIKFYENRVTVATSFVW